MKKEVSRGSKTTNKNDIPPLAESPVRRICLPPGDHLHQPADPLLVLRGDRISVPGLRRDTDGICAGTSAVSGGIRLQSLLPVPSPLPASLCGLPLPQIHLRIRRSLQPCGKSPLGTGPRGRSCVRDHTKYEIRQRPDRISDSASGSCLFLLTM